jgi:putative iron-dependent peroxidase
LSFHLRPGADPRRSLAQLAAAARGVESVVGIGASCVSRLGARVEGLRDLPSFEGALEAIPASPRALWLWIRGEDRGELLHRGAQLSTLVEAHFELADVLDAFRYDGGRDLTGYEDGTENPKGEAASEAAIVAAGASGCVGSSFVAVQRWQHDLARFAGFPAAEQDAIVGRRRADNAELAEAPASSHVKRTAQESFSPTAFMLRRSMPWIAGTASGLEFVAFGRSFYAFEAQLRRMLGLEDGISDALFRFSRVLHTSSYWCPPLRDGQLDLRLIGL